MTDASLLDSSLNDSPVLAQLDVGQKERLSELLDRYLCALEDAEPLTPETLLVGNEDLSEVLRFYLAKLDELHGIANGRQPPAPLVSPLGINPVADGRAEPSDPFAATVDGRADALDLPLGSFTEGDLSQQDLLRLGDYRIVREIGRGGMGIVYEAEQISLGRRVALKLLPMAAVLDARQIARFRNESHAAGQLNHPHIVPVYSVGVQRGIHFYAMQRIDGVAIDQWIAQQQQHRTVTWRYAVRLAIDAADALHCAHTSGIVHRDVKPSNLLLETSKNRSTPAKVWITDFGLARCQNDLSLTMTGDLIGTMRYMSPEQAAGRMEWVDHRCDIYSLGATLYEMLTLQPAVPGEDTPALLRAIEQTEPTPLHRLLPEAPADLGIVLRKAMSKRRDDRYATAEAFGRDLQAVLDGQPVVAKPLSASTLAARWIQRHRKLVSLASAAALLLMIGLIAITIGIAQKNLLIAQQNHDLTTQQAQLRISKERSERFFVQAQATVDQFFTKFAEQLIGVPGTERLQQSLRTLALSYYQDFVRQASDDPELRSRLALAHARIGILLRDGSQPEAAIEQFLMAEALYDQLTAADDGDDMDAPAKTTLQRQLADTLNHLGLAYQDAGAATDAEAAFLRSLELHQKLGPHQRPSSGVARGTTSPQADDRCLAATEHAMTLSNLGLLYTRSGRTQQATLILTDAVDRFAGLVDADDQNLLAVRGLAVSQNTLSSLLSASDPDAAVSLLKEALRSQLHVARHPETRMRMTGEIANTYSNLGSVYLTVGDAANANAALENAVKLLRLLSDIAPNVETHWALLAANLNDQATALSRLRRDHESQAIARNAIGIQRMLVEKSPEDAGRASRLGVMLANLAVSLSATGKHDEAIALFGDAVMCQADAMRLASDNPVYIDLWKQHHFDCLMMQVRTQNIPQTQRAAHAYRQTAGADAPSLLLVGEELTELSRDIEVEAVQHILLAEAAAALQSAAQHGATVDQTLFRREPFRRFANHRMMQKVLFP